MDRAETMTPPPDVLHAVREARSIALISHVNPDADALASLAALWLALPGLEKRAHLVLPQGTVSRRLEFLVRLAKLHTAHADDVRECDLILALDTAKEKRLNAEDHHQHALTRIPILNIDHHETNPSFGRWNWIEPHASSTSELIFELLTALGCPITPLIATLLYAGIHTDTQGFSLANTTPESLRVGHALAAAGAQIVEVCERLHRSQSRGEFDLRARVYHNTQVSPDGRLAWSMLNHADIVATGCHAADIDDQVEIPRSIEGIAVAILFSEGEPERVRMNFRGERGVSVLPLAVEFGGGGHAQAAGARLSGTLAEIMERVLPAAQAYVARLNLEEMA